MKPTIEVDFRAWQKAANDLFRTSSRSLVDFTNGQALRVAIDAVRQTEKTDANKVKYQLGAVVKSQDKTTGKLKFTRRKKILQVKDDSLAQRILAKRFQTTGQWGVKGSTMQERIHNFIAARSRSVSFIASGWIAARNKLFPLVRQKAGVIKSTGGAKAYGKPKGTARPAMNSLTSKISAEIENTALLQPSKEPSVVRNPMVPAQAGLQRALQNATRDMIETLAKRLKQDLAKFGSK